MEPIPERIPDIGLEGGQIGNQDNHDGFEQNNPEQDNYKIMVATNGILSALTHGLVSKDRVNEVEKFLGETESTTPERMFESANLLMLHDFVSFVDSYRADLRNRINMGYMTDPIKEELLFNNVFSNKLQLYSNFLDTLSGSFENTNNEAVQNYRNSLADILNFVNNHGAVDYILSDEQSQSYTQSVNALSNIRNNASLLYKNIMQRQTNSQQVPVQNQNSITGNSTPQQIDDEGSLDFSSKNDLSLIKNAMDLHVAYGAFGVAMACAPIFAPVYTVALLWFIINYELKPCKIESENKIKFATKRTVEGLLKNDNVVAPPAPLKNISVPTLDFRNDHQKDNLPMQDGIPPQPLRDNGVIPPYNNGYMRPDYMDRPQYYSYHNFHDVATYSGMSNFGIPITPLVIVKGTIETLTGRLVVLKKEEFEKRVVIIKDEEEKKEEENKKEEEKKKEEENKKEEEKKGEWIAPPEKENEETVDIVRERKKNEENVEQTTTGQSTQEESKKTVKVLVRDFDIDLSIEKNAKSKYSLDGVFGAEHQVVGDMEEKAGIPEMLDSYNKGPNGSSKNKGAVGNSTFSDFNDLIRFFEFCYRYEANSSRYPRTGVYAANRAIGLKIKFIDNKLKEKIPDDIKLKLVAMRQMLEDVRKNGNSEVYKNNPDFSVTAQTDSQNRLHTRVVFDPNDDHNYVGLRRVGEGEFESLDRVTLFRDIGGSPDSYRVEIDKEGNCVISKFVGNTEECVECSDLDEKTRESIVRVAKVSLEKLKQKENGREEEAPTPPVKSKPQPTKSTDSSMVPKEPTVVASNPPKKTNPKTNSNVPKRSGFLTGLGSVTPVKSVTKPTKTFNTTPPSVNSARSLKNKGRVAG